LESEKITIGSDFQEYDNHTAHFKEKVTKPLHQIKDGVKLGDNDR
jgi:hypothetical protein